MRIQNETNYKALITEKAVASAYRNIKYSNKCGNGNYI